MSDSTNDAWDVVVIGAGPAGALAARQLAIAGRRVLLIEKKTFPRDKVCGACLNPQSLSALTSVGLSSLVAANGGVPLEHFSLRAGSRPLNVSLPRGMALSRSVFDAALVAEAVSSGVVFQPATEARVERPSGAETSSRLVRLTRAAGDVTMVRASVVVVADGLSRSSVTDWPEFAGKVLADSRIGIGVMVSCHDESLTRGTIFMSVARAGYVGMVRVEDGRLNVAAAIDPHFVKASGGMEAAVTACLREAGWKSPWPDAVGNTPHRACESMTWGTFSTCQIDPLSSTLESCSTTFSQPPHVQPNWMGTPLLTRRAARVAASRVLLLGDSAGYVEPFTGEGIAWALTGALAAVPIIERGLQTWDDSVEAAWSQTYLARIRQRQSWCRRFAGCLRYPRLVQLAVGGLRRFPSAARWLARRMG